MNEQTLAYQLAPAGPNGRTRVLTTLVKLMPTLDIQRLFHQEHSKPPSEYELNLARGQVGWGSGRERL